MKKILFLLSLLFYILFSDLPIVNAQSVSSVSYGINYYRYNTSATSSTVSNTFNFNTTGTLPIYPISGFQNNYYAFAWYGIDFLSDSPVNGSAIGYKITATFKIAMDGLVNNIGSTAFTGFVHFNNGTIKDEVSTVEVIGLEDGSGTFKITSVVTLTNETDLSGLTYSLRANSSIGSAPYGNTVYTQLSALDTTVELTNDLNSAILNSINSNQQITNDKLDQIDKNQQATNDKLDETNQNLNDINDTLHNGDVKDFSLGDFDLGIDLDPENSPVSALITLPVSLLNAFLSGLEGQCYGYTIPFFFGEDLTFPCIDLEDYLGSELWNTIDLICCIFLIYNIAMMVVSFFEKITSLQDAFDSMYAPRHQAVDTYIPKHGGE